MTNWSLEDYRDYYNERAGIYLEAGIFKLENHAEMEAYNDTLKLFKEQEKPTMAYIRHFHYHMRINKKKY
jgi:hypothetical protein